MIIKCTKQEFKNMIVSCQESSSCFCCALKEFCLDENIHANEKHKGDLLPIIVDIVPDSEGDQ